MKLVGTSCKSHEISQDSLGGHNMLLHEDHMKKFKGNAEKYAVYKEKDRVWKRESRKKALSPKTATVEMEIQRKSELVDTKRFGRHNMLFRQAISNFRAASCGKLFKIIRKHKRV